MRKFALVASVALALLAPDPADSADTRSFTAGQYFLQLDGVKTGFLKSVEGGHATADVVTERDSGGSLLVRKHLAGVKYEDLTIEFDPGLPAVMDWINATLGAHPTRKNGAVVAADYNLTEMRRLEFSNALITEIGIPALDASAKDAAHLTLKFSPETTKWKPGTNARLDPPPNGNQKAFLPSNFRVSIGDLPCAKVNKIEAIVIKQKNVENPVGEQRDYQKEPASVEVPNLKVWIDVADVRPWRDWFQSFVLDGASSDASELTGSIELLANDGKAVLLAIDLKHVGIFSLNELPEPNPDPGVARRRFTVELYVEQMEFRSDSK